MGVAVRSLKLRDVPVVLSVVVLKRRRIDEHSVGWMGRVIAAGQSDRVLAIIVVSGAHFHNNDERIYHAEDPPVFACPPHPIFDREEVPHRGRRYNVVHGTR